MKALWNWIERREVRRSAKNRNFLCLTVLNSALAGGIVWLAAGRLIMPGIEDLLAFLLVPAVLFGFFGGIVYLYNHDFSENRWKAPAARARRAANAETAGKNGTSENAGKTANTVNA